MIDIQWEKRHVKQTVVRSPSCKRISTCVQSWSKTSQQNQRPRLSAATAEEEAYGRGSFDQVQEDLAVCLTLPRRMAFFEAGCFERCEFIVKYFRE